MKRNFKVVFSPQLIYEWFDTKFFLLTTVTPLFMNMASTSAFQTAKKTTVIQTTTSMTQLDDVNVAVSLTLKLSTSTARREFHDRSTMSLNWNDIDDASLASVWSPKKTMLSCSSNGSSSTTQRWLSETRPTGASFFYIISIEMVVIVIKTESSGCCDCLVGPSEIYSGSFAQ